MALLGTKDAVGRRLFPTGAIPGCGNSPDPTGSFQGVRTLQAKTVGQAGARSACFILRSPTLRHVRRHGEARPALPCVVLNL
jgi:hypothetical protein